jgi:hypothetical protein
MPTGTVALFPLSVSQLKEAMGDLVIDHMGFIK